MEIVKAKTREPGLHLIMVDGVEWGRFEMLQHGPQGNSYILFQAYGNYVRDGGTRQGLKVYGDKLTRRIVLERPWHRPDLTIEQRLFKAAEYAIENKLLRDPAVLRAEDAAQEELYQRKAAEQRAKERARDVGVASIIIRTLFPSGNEVMTASIEQALADMIADAIERGRSE